MALPHTLVMSLAASGGPLIDGTPAGGSSIPNTLLRVARLTCAVRSARGSQAVLASRTAAVAASSRSAETSTDGYRADASSTARRSV